MADLPITQVGRIDGLSIGQPSITNTAKGVTAQTLGDVVKVGKPALFHTEYLSHKLHLNFLNDLTAYPNRFIFNGSIVQTKVTIGDTLVMGSPTVTKGAQAVRPPSIDTSRFGKPALSEFGPQPLFNFNSNSSAIKNEVYFHFGTQKVISQAGGIKPPVIIGIEKTKIAFTIAPEGIYKDHKSLPGIFHGNNPSIQLDFKFDTTTIRDYIPGSRNFIFDGPQLIIKVGLGETLNIGLHVIRNAAQAINRFDGIASKAKVGYPVTYIARKKPESIHPLDFGFNQDIRSSNALNVPFHFYFDYEIPTTGSDMLMFGQASIENTEDIVIPKGINSDVYGVANVRLGVSVPQRIWGEGFEISAYGLPSIELKSRVIGQLGWGSLSFGKSLIEYKNSYINVPGLGASAVGIQFISHYLRTIFTGVGIDHSALGLPWVSYRVRSVETEGISAYSVPVHKVSRQIVVKVDGFDAALFGERITPEPQAMYAHGFSGSYGIPTVYLKTQYVHTNGTDYNQISSSVDKVYNLTQFVDVKYYQESGLNPPEWSKWIYVENRNKNPVTHGTFFQSFGRPLLHNNAAPIKVKGIESLNFGKNWISHFIRTVVPETFSESVVSRWSAVHNDARVLNAKSVLDHSAFGKPALLNTRRYFKYIGAIDSQAFGEPMIAYRVREIDIETRYGIHPPQIPLPFLYLSTRYIETAGKDFYGTGNAHLEIKWNKITTRWAQQELYGLPTVRNVTPQLYTDGHNAETFGENKIRLEWEQIAVPGFNHMLFGRTLIEYRTKHVKPLPLISQAFGLDTQVIKTASPPYTTQYVYLGPGSDEDTNRLPHQGIYTDDKDRFGLPRFIQNWLIVTGIKATAFGTTTIHSNGILVEPGIFDHYLGTPFVSARVRKIAPSGIGSTFTISNYAMLSPIVITPRTFNESFVSQPIVDHYHRKLTLEGRNVSALGSARVELSKRYIYPTGINGLRLGWLTFPSEETLEAESIESEFAAGLPTVKRPPYLGPQTIYPYGINATIFDKSFIELFNREVLTKGHDSLVMGNSRGPLNPYMWQSLRIGERIPTAIGGYYATTFGATWISNWVREIKPESFDAHRNEYDFTRFDQRMRVRLETLPISTITQTISAFSFNTEAVGTPNIKLAVHYIRPDGNSDQFRKSSLSFEGRVVSRYLLEIGSTHTRYGYASVRYAQSTGLDLNFDTPCKEHDGTLNFDG